MHEREGVERKGVGMKGVRRKGVGRKRVGRKGKMEWTGRVDRNRRDGWTGKGRRGGQKKGGDKRVSNLENLVELGLVQELRMTSLHTLKLNGNLLPVGDVYT